MSSNWPQEGQSQGGGNTGQQPSAPPPVRKHTLNRPPVCYNCEGEHFVIDCPQNQQNQGVTARSRPHNNRSSTFPSAPPPYRQPPGPGPPPQSFPPQGGPVQYPQYPPNQQYGPPATPYPSYPPPQQPYTAPYTAPPPNQQYPQPVAQPPTYNQYNQNSAPPQGPPQYSGPVYQPPPPQYNNTRPPAPYRAPVNPPYPRTPGHRYDYQPTGTPAYYGATSSQPQLPPQQWNSTPSTSQSPYPKLQRNNSGFKREFSGTPSHHSQQQYQPVRSQSQQLDHLPDVSHRTPQTPSSSSGKAQQAPQQNLQDSPAKQQTGSIPSTPASQSNNRRASVAPSTVGPSKAEQVAPVIKDEPEAEVQPEQEAEEGEVQEGDESDDEEERFSWELEVMFREPPKLETVALAQPLSAGFESTPVPLVQAWSTNVPSISRYARKDNLKEFVRSVRSAPQWSYLQEDPAFAEITDEGDLIPLSELAAWMDIHHGRTIAVEEAEDESISRKRARPDGENAEQDDEQENVDQQIALEVATEEQGEEPPSKRQKNEETDELDEIMRSPSRRTPTYLISNRGGTPCLATTDDAWAPQPGECATSPGDPTENLLASLGVTGDAKPVAQDSLPPYMPKEDQDQSAHSSQTQTPVVTQQPTQGPPANTSRPDAYNQYAQNNAPSITSGPSNNQQYGPPANGQYGNGNMPNPLYGQGPPANNSQGPLQYGPPANIPQGPPQYSAPVNNPQGPPQYGPPINVPYGNGPPQNMAGPPQYGPPINAPYGSGPPNSYLQGPPQGPPQGSPQGPPQGPPQWGAQRNPSFGSAQQYPAPQQYSQYGPPQNAPYNTAPYGPPANQYGNAPPVQYPQGPPQYNQARQPSYGAGPLMQGQYGPLAQTSPTQYGPPQNMPYGAPSYPNQPQYQPGPPVASYGNVPPNNTQYPSMPPNQQMPPNPNMPPNHQIPPQQNMPPNQNMPLNQQQYGNVPPRQDSGYVSARGSYSAGSAPNGYDNQAGPQDPTLPAQGQPFSDARNRQVAGASVQEPGNQQKNENSANSHETASNDTVDSSPGTPLSPTSAEILGKLVRKPKKGKTASGQERASVRKVKKRPQPVVAEAYSRRW